MEKVYDFKKEQNEISTRISSRNTANRQFCGGGYFFSLKNARSANGESRAVSETWLDHADTTWSGSGTETDPYQISSAEELAGLAKRVDNGEFFGGKYFKQTADINLGGYEWNPIGRYGWHDLYFEGVYDGGDYEISYMKINTDDNYQGLFASVIRGTVKNVNLVNSTIVATGEYVGGIAGVADTGVTIENCTVDAYIVGSIDVGGIAGLTSGATIKNCVFSGYVEATSYRVGGIAGSMWKGAWVLIQNCCNYGIVKSPVAIGGILGYGGGTDTEGVTIENCISEGSLIGTQVEFTEMGGIVGVLYTGGTIKNCHSSSQLCSISESERRIGGVLGFGKADITNCSYVGGGTSGILPFYGKESTETTVTSCFSVINGQGYYSNGDFAEFGLCKNINSELPVQKALYYVAQFGDSVNSTWFAGNNFQKT